MDILIALIITGAIVLVVSNVIFPKKKNRVEQAQILDGQKAREIKESTYIEEEVKKGKPSLWNFRRWSTICAYIVGLPLYFYIVISYRLNVGIAIIVSILPSWVVFRVIEYTLTKKTIVALSDDELTSISDTRVGELGYELQKIAQDELKRRSDDARST